MKALLSQTLPELAIAQQVNIDLAAAILDRGHICEIKRRCQESVFWPSFCQLVAQNKVDLDFAGPGPISRCVIGWAKEDA